MNFVEGEDDEDSDSQSEVLPVESKKGEANHIQTGPAFSVLASKEESQAETVRTTPEVIIMHKESESTSAVPQDLKLQKAQNSSKNRISSLRSWINKKITKPNASLNDSYTRYTKAQQRLRKANASLQTHCASIIKEQLPTQSLELIGNDGTIERLEDILYNLKRIRKSFVD